MTKTALMTVLLAGTALVSTAGIARADQPVVTAAGAAAMADGAAQSPSRTTVEEVVIHSIAKQSTGGGLIKPEIASKSISTISSAFIQTQPSIQNAYQYVALTPGALVSTTDPYGLAEQGSINVHGLGQDELGYVLEGMPLNDIGFYTAYPSQFIDSENIDEISLAQGSADLDSPVISAAGGLMNITMLDPSVKAGGNIDVGYGSYNTHREFLRLDSGLIGNTGVRGFVSYSYTGSDNWRGPGRVIRQHADLKLVKEWGENRVTLAATYHNGVTPLYIQPTLDDYKANGINDNYEAKFTPATGYNYYKLHTGVFRILYISAPSHFKIADHLTWNVTPYWQYGYGNGPYGTTIDGAQYQGEKGYSGSGPYTYDPTLDNSFNVNVPNGTANGNTVMANYQDLQYRAGVVTKLTYDVGPNSFIAGYWYDYSDERDTQTYSGLSATGEPADYWVDSSHMLLRMPNGKLFLAGADHVITKTNEIFVADTLHLMDNKLTLEIGFKEAFVSRGGTNNVPGSQYKVVINNSEPLPRAAARYQIDDHNQVFASVTTNFRTPSEATLFNGYYGGGKYFSANTNLKPEYSVAEDVGYRYSGPMVTATVSFFNYNFSNRQVATIVGGSQLNESINAGGQTTRGIDIEAGTRPWHHISPYVSAEYLHSTIDSDLPYDTTYLPTAGKTAVRSPEFQAALGLNYDDGTFFGNFNVKWVDSQYATFMNDEKIPSYATANLSIGARLPSIGLKARPEIKLNLVNLGGPNYLSAVANPTANAHTVIARDGRAVEGSAPTYYLSGGFAAMFTASAAF